MLSQNSFKTYAHRVLKQIHPETQITKQAMEALDSSLRVVTTELCNRAAFLTRSEEKKTISAKEVQTAVRVTFPPELATESVSEGTTAVTKFVNSSNKPEKTTEKKNASTQKAKPISRTVRAGLNFSVSLAEKYLRGFGQVKYNVGAGAPVYLAAVAENLCQNILDGAGTVARDSNKVTVNIRHLFLAINNDSAVSRLFNELNMVLLGGGVVPHIHSSLLPKKKGRRRQMKKKGDSTRPHRFLPGTVALRNIRHTQKDGKLLFQRAPFERVVRELSTGDLRFTHDFLLEFQTLVEHDIVTMFEDANRVVIHNLRETLSGKDINLVLALRGVEYDDVKCEVELPEAGLRKLSHRGGVKRLAADGVTTMRTFAVHTISRYLRNICFCLEHHNGKTVNTKMMIEGLALTGVHVASVPHKRRVGKKKAGEDTKVKSGKKNVDEVVVSEDVVSDSDDDEDTDDEVEDEPEPEPEPAPVKRGRGRGRKRGTK